MFVVFTNFSKSKKSNKIIQITKNKYTIKILRYASFAFLKIVIVVNILIVQKKL